MTRNGRVRMEARSLRFSYRSPVVVDFSLRLTAGRVTGIIGPNGSGKTTVLKLLDGILTPDAGDVLLPGTGTIARLPRKLIARQIALVPQSPGFSSEQTVFQFVLQGRSPHLSLLAVENEQDEKIAREALERTRLTALSEVRVHEISGGEKQRLLLARALAQQPKILLLDEFTANLDINYQLELMRLVLGITRAEGLATLVVSHEINLVAGFCDQIVLMSNGAIRHHGEVSDVLTPANLKDLFGVDFSIRPLPEGGLEVVPVIDRGKL